MGGSFWDKHLPAAGRGSRVGRKGQIQDKEKGWGRLHRKLEDEMGDNDVRPKRDWGSPGKMLSPAARLEEMIAKLQVMETGLGVKC